MESNILIKLSHIEKVRKIFIHFLKIIFNIYNHYISLKAKIAACLIISKSV